MNDKMLKRIILEEIKKVLQEEQQVGLLGDGSPNNPYKISPEMLKQYSKYNRQEGPPMLRNVSEWYRGQVMDAIFNRMISNPNDRLRYHWFVLPIEMKDEKMFEFDYTQVPPECAMPDQHTRSGTARCQPKIFITTRDQAQSQWNEDTKQIEDRKRSGNTAKKPGF
jgi:hypothetical protein